MSGIATRLAYLGIIPALGAASLTCAVSIDLTEAPQNTVTLAVGILVLTGYFIDHAFPHAGDAISNPERALYFSKLPRKLLIACTLLLASLAVLLVAPVSAKLALGTLGLITMSYIGPQLSLKRILLLKNILVALVWGGIPIISSSWLGVPWSVQTWHIAGLISLRIFIGSVACDVRDVQGDAAMGIQTLPIRFGVERTVWMLTLCNSISLVWIMLAGFPVWIVAPFFSQLIIFSLGVTQLSSAYASNVLIDMEYILIGVIAYGFAASY